MSADPYRYFRIEAREIVDQLGKGLLDLERLGGGGGELVAGLLRLAHTLKGAARIVRHKELAELAHLFESELEPLRGAVAPAGRRDVALALVDRMEACVVAMTKPEAASPQLAAAAPPSAAAAVAPPTTVAAVAAPTTVDDILDGLAELHAQLARLRDARHDELPRRIEALERELRVVRADAEQLRLVAVRSMFTALERTARDASATKRIAFGGAGGDIRLDAAVVAAIQPALVQLVRNAVVHGVEELAGRAAAGKPAEATVAITARQHGGRVTFACEDDGRGIDLEAVRAELGRRGVASRELADPDELIRHLLRGGISTTTAVTELSGRGIGLDLVRDTVRRLGGELTATTRAGAGTTVALTVPVSLHAMSVVVVEAGGRRAAIPREVVRTVQRLRGEDLVTSGGARSVALDGQLVPYAPLGRLLGEPDQAARSILVIESERGTVAVGVDRVIAVDEVVHRARPRAAPIDLLVSGLAVDAEARPLPILDPVVVAVRVAAVVHAPVHTRAAPAPILVVDDSLTTRMLEQSILESAGYTVELAASAEDALARAAHTRYALFLVDVEMPGMDGFQLVTEIRARPALAAIPAILVTSRNAPEDLRRGVEVGAQGYIVKGEFDQTLLLRRIAELIDRTAPQERSR